MPPQIQFDTRPDAATLAFEGALCRLRSADSHRFPGAWGSLDASIHDAVPVRALLAGSSMCPPDAPAVCLLDYELASAMEPAIGISRENRDRSCLYPCTLRSPTRPCSSGVSTFSVSPLTSRQGRRWYESRVRSAVELIRAGDIFQVNLAHQLIARFSGSARALFDALTVAARPAFAVYLELPDRVVCSFSPELFLHLDAPSGRCLTRPMKGTATTREALHGSIKDRAELRMIVDLMRNDLSRVCRIGSVRVEHARTLESHAGGAVIQGVASVRGILRPGMDWRDLVRAAFPAGSITGAPKVRAMQIIHDLEGFPRGAYCGSMGILDADGSLTLNVGIRTATITGRQIAPGIFEEAELVFPVGAGIVADSTPEHEWEETIRKASLWRAVASVRG